MRVNKIYKAISGELQHLENEKALRRNSHHLAQQLSSLVEYELLTKKQKIIFHAIYSLRNCTAKQIATATGDISKNISAHLHAIMKKTTLIVCDKGGKRKYKIANRHYFKRHF